MPTRSAHNQVAYVAKEDEPGVLPGSPAYYQLSTIGLSPVPNIGQTLVTPAGRLIATTVTPGNEWSTFTISGAPSHSEEGLLFRGMWGDPTTEGQIDTSGAYQHVWTLNGASVITPITQTLVKGDDNFAESSAAQFVSEITKGIAWNGMTLGGTGMGTQMATGATVPGSSTRLADIPMAVGTTGVYLDTTAWTDLGDTLLTDVQNVQLRFGGWLGPYFTVNPTTRTFQKIVQTRPTNTMSLEVQADDVLDLLLDAARAGTTCYVRVETISLVSIGLNASSAPVYYKHRYDMALKVTNARDFTDAQSVYTVPFEFGLVDDSTADKALEVTIVDKIAAY